MSGEGREMTLNEWVSRLPPIHSARREYEQLRERVAELERKLLELVAQKNQAIEREAQLKAENAQLRADSERLEWLSEGPVKEAAVAGHDDYDGWVLIMREHSDLGGVVIEEPTLREAIDAARHRETQVQGGGEE